MTLRVLQLGPVPPPEGGVSRHLSAIRRELSLRGDDCFVIATTRGGGDGDGIFRPSGALELLRLVRRLDCEILHLHVGGAISTRVLALGLACATFGRGRKVVTIHSGGFAVSEAKQANRKSLAAYVFRRFDHIVAVSEAIQHVMLRFGVPRDRVSVISPFALSQTESDQQLPKALEDFAAAHSPLLIAVGGLEPDYDPELLLEAMRQTTGNLANAGLIIIGDGSMRPEIEAGLKNHPARDRILLAGNVDHAVTIQLMKTTDVMLRTTRFDGDALSVREALALGTPVVATDTGNRPDGVRLISIGDSEGLLAAIRDAVKEGRTGASGEDGSENIRAVIRLYEELAGR
jgi:glycogen synthase